MTERAERERISHQVSLSLFRMPHAELAALLAPKGTADWLLADLTVAELRRAYRRRAVREDDRVLYGLRAWGTADSLSLKRRRVVNDLRTVVDPVADYTVQCLAGRLYANPAPSPLEVGRVIDHALALRDIGERYGARGIRAARFATWDYVPVDEFEEQMVVFAEFIDRFTVVGEPITELIEAGLPDWARPLIEA